MLRFIAVIELQMQIKINIRKLVCDNIQGNKIQGKKIKSQSSGNLKQIIAVIQAKQLEHQYCHLHRFCHHHLGLGDCEVHFLEKKQKGLGMSHNIH